MASQRPSAAKPLLALIAGLAALSGGAARAQDDPFALPTGTTVKAAEQAVAGPLLSELQVDGAMRHRLVEVQGRGQELTIGAEDARAAGLPVPESASGRVKLASLPLYKWSFDTLRQRLSVQLFRNNDGPNLRDLSRKDWDSAESHPLTAFRIDYDLSATVAQRGSRAGGLVETSLVRGGMALGTSARIGTSGEPGARDAVRLDSFAQIALTKHSAILTAGDFISAGSQSQRAVRMGGIQLASNFSLRPDLITSPLPTFSGKVAVPTNIDIMTADQRYSIGELEPGAFTVRNVPSNEGRGEFSVVTRDALGREVVQTTRFYVSHDLLAPGTTGYAVNAGFVRRRYGIVSNDYGPLVASAFLRRGLSPFLTLEASGESTGGLVNFGTRGIFTLGNLLLINTEGRFSHDTQDGNGTLANFALESMGQRAGGRIGASIPSENYRDVASRLGDTLPSRQVFADFFYRLGPNTQIQFAYLRQDRRADPRLGNPALHNEVTSASFRAPISSRIDLFASGGLRKSDRRSLFASVGVSVNLGSPRHLGAYAGIEGDNPSAGVSFSKDDVKDGDIGYRASANVAPNYQRITGQVGWRARNTRLVGLGEEVNGRLAGRINANGTLLIAGGTVYARNRSGGSYALVKTGKVGGVAIKLENRVVGKTDSRGHLLIQDIPALVPMHVDVDTDKLPGDALVRRARRIVSVPQRAVAVVEMDVTRFRPVLRRIVDTSGTPLDAGLPITAAPSGAESLIGFDGMAEINAAGGDRRLVIGPPGRSCVVDLPDGDAIESGESALVCRIETIADNGRGPEKAKQRAGVKVARRD